MAKVTKKKEKVEEKVVPTPQPREEGGWIGNIGTYKPIPRFGGCRGC